MKKKRFYFDLTISGIGKDADEAWNDACDMFSEDPGVAEPHIEGQSTEIDILKERIKNLEEMNEALDWVRYYAMDALEWHVDDADFKPDWFDDLKKANDDSYVLEDKLKKKWDKDGTLIQQCN
ncbi:MAG: hypothetical protein KQI81_08735 [Deltaproteobacteria bacterium]|nr:hypothetical protein [Deltaproteobacteria bacterium]